MDEFNEVEEDYSDLPFFQEMKWEDWEEHAKAEYELVIEEWNNTLIFDAGSGKKITVKQFEKFYGTDEFSKELVDAANNRTQYSRETAGKIKSLHAKLTRPQASPVGKVKPPWKPPAHHKPKRSSQDQFIAMPYCFVEKVKDAGCHHNPTALLMILLKHRSWPGKYDKHHTYTYWYEKRKLIVASRSITSLAEELGASERTVRNYLRMLEQNGDIETMKGEKFASQRENVYVLGRIDENGNEILYHTGQE